MSYIKNTLPDYPACSHFCEEICVECQYILETAHIPERYRPSITTWYNKPTKRGKK